ncbi:MAG: sigma factor [Isosphaeraceae bacterium]
MVGAALRVKVEPSDLVQETFLKAHREFAGFAGQGEHELVAWLRRILARTVADQVKHHRRMGRDLQRQESLDLLLERSDETIHHALASYGASPSERLLPGRSLRGAERPACKPRGASGIAALVEFAPCGARRHGVPHPLGVAFASPHRLAATCQSTANRSRSGGVAVLRQSRSALRRSQLGHRHGRAIGAGMDDSASWKTEETIIRLATVTSILQIWWPSPFTFVVAVTFHIRDPSGPDSSRADPSRPSASPGRPRRAVGPGFVCHGPNPPFDSCLATGGVWFGNPSDVSSRLADPIESEQRCRPGVPARRRRAVRPERPTCLKARSTRRES